MTSPGEEVTVFTSPYLSSGAPTLGEARRLRKITSASENEIEIDKNLTIKNPQEKKDLELIDIADDWEEKESESEN